ncbi:short-chain dehydrogenase/reductase [Bosea sp. 124]|uniref:short-chain dehydrogenase/reductase n=1 Tax=Bosea sp. 124 TaxID=2135642 RepID=UPI000D3A193B|nr:short-chain dehydrogenase/reductase [Bosea sp. 124]PTM40016.1 NAD(P)-dependent dehydrogenase (short-subunit alcohol dehydrogenase family) [Bosea sp. 124]
MDLKLSGRRVLITGGSKGIGEACARVFLAEGCSIVLIARDAARLSATAAALGEGNRVMTHAADLSADSERERLAAAFPDIDILVNNAGAIPAGGLLDLSMETWDQAWALKVMGYIHLTKLYLAGMKERGSGVIVNIIGGAGRSPRYDYVCGGTGNAALMAFTGAVGGRSVEWGVRVFGVNPAQTRTDRIISLSKTRAKIKFGDEARWEEMLTGLPLNRLIEPDEIANAAAFLASPACGYVSGTVLDVDGGGAFRG